MQLPMKHACAVDPYSRGESGWCPDGTSTPGAWRHAGVQFLLSGVFVVGCCAGSSSTYPVRSRRLDTVHRCCAVLSTVFVGAYRGQVTATGHMV